MNEYLYKNIYIGQEEKFCVEITNEKVEIFRKLSGDENPLHTDADYARKKGYQNKIVYGMLIGSYLSTLAGMYMPGKFSLIHSVQIDFHAPVYVKEKETLQVKGKVTKKNDLFKIISVKYTIENHQGKQVCKGNLEIGVIDGK